MALVVQRSIVPGHMQPHFTVVPESFPTDGTLERRFPRVVSDVNFVPVPIRVGVVAVLALKGRIQFVSLFISRIQDLDWHSGKDHVGVWGLGQSHRQG